MNALSFIGATRLLIQVKQLAVDRADHGPYSNIGAMTSDAISPC